jgi:hypothetical protein
MPIAVLEPPAQYVHRYHGPVIERVLPLSEARRLCARMGAPADGCSWTSRGKCYIVIPRNGPVRDLGGYRRHEMAHCNGWSSHAGGHAPWRTSRQFLQGSRRRTAKQRDEFPDPSGFHTPGRY